MQPCLASVYHSTSYYGGNEHYLDYLAQEFHHLNLPFRYLTGFAQPPYPSYPLTLIPTSKILNKPAPNNSWYRPLPEKCDVYHASGSGLPLLVLAAYLKHHYPRIPRILTYQADSTPGNSLFKVLVSLEQKCIPQYFNHIITTSPFYQATLQTRWPKTKVYFIPLFLSPLFMKYAKYTLPLHRRFHPAKDSKAVLFVGQLDSNHYYKDLPTFLRSIAVLPANYHGFIIGGGDRLPEYKRLSTHLNVSFRVHFLGEVPHQKLPAYFRHVDIFVLPSSSASEGFGMVCLEAMSQKIPVITTTAIGSASYFNTHKVARLIPPQNSRLLAKTIKQVSNDPSSHLITRAYEFAKNHSLASMAQKTLNLYQDIAR